MDIPKNLKENEIKTDEGIRDITREQKNNEKEIKSISDLVLVHLTDYIPKDGIIRTPKEAGATLSTSFLGHKFETPRERKTIHFTLNGEVTNNTGGSFHGRKYAIIIPLKNIDKEKIAGGNLADIYTNGSLKIPEGSYILCPSREHIEGQIGDNLQVIEYETTDITQSVDGYANLLISKLGYKVERVGFDEWTNDSDTKKAQSILNKEKYIANHFGRHADSRYMRAENILQANNALKLITKILLENEIDIDYPEYKIYLTDDGIIDFKEPEYVEDLYKKLKEIGLEIPDSVKQEIESINRGDYEKTDEIEEVFSRARDDIDLRTETDYYLPGLMLKRRIIGEIELKKIAQEIKEISEGIEPNEVLSLFKEKGIDYTTGNRRIEFLQELGLNLSDMELAIISNNDLLKQYAHILDIKDIPYSELSEEDQILANKFRRIYETADKKSGNYYIISDLNYQDDGTIKEYLALGNITNNFKLSQEEIEKLGSEFLGEGLNERSILNFELGFKQNESLSEYCERFETYKEKILKAVGEIQNKQNEEITVDRLGKETLEEQKDTKGKNDMENLLNIRLQEFVLAQQGKQER